MKALTKCKSEIDSQGRKVLRFTPTEWEALESKMDALEASHRELQTRVDGWLSANGLGGWIDDLRKSHKELVGALLYIQNHCQLYGAADAAREKADKALANAEKIAK